MAGLTFVATTPDDRDEVEALLAETYPALLAADYSPDLLAAILPAIIVPRESLLASGTYFIARDTAGLTLAAGGWTREAPGPERAVTPGTGHIRHVVTRLGRTGEGIGRALMRHLMDDARAAGMARLDCLSTLTAVPYDAACGFAVEAQVDVPVGPGLVLPSVRMLRAL